METTPQHAAEGPDPRPVAIPTADFYVTGGSLAADAPSYVKRRADEALFAALERGEFCYVLDTRQVGKSSLLVRVAAHLERAGVRTVLLDLTALGRNVTPEQWYGGLLYRLAEQADALDAADAFWEGREAAGLGPAQRWFAAVRAVAAAGPLCVLVDEIDSVRGLPFSADEFFAGIRECHERRGRDPALRRLTFCLAGSATPSQVIGDVLSTPFNVGRRVEVTDFTEEEALPLARGLAGGPSGDGPRLLRRVLFWTGGHPYLTQRLCRAVGEAGAAGVRDVDRACARTFLTREAAETDDNLRFAQRRLLESHPDPAAVLALHARILRGPVRFEPGDEVADVLRLAGVASARGGQLRVRNRIYARSFDARWVREHLPGAERRRQRRALYAGFARASALWLTVGAGLALAFGQWQAAQEARAQAAESGREVRRVRSERDRLAGETAAATNALIDVRARRQAADRDLRTAEAALKRLEASQAQAEAELARARKQVRAQEARARQEIGQAHAEQGRAETAAERARERANAARADAAAAAKAAASQYGQVASALARVRGRELDALDAALREVDYLRRTRGGLEGGGPAADGALQHLADAVNVGVVRYLRLEHAFPLSCARFSPDGARILTAGRSPEAYLWDARTGRKLQTLRVAIPEDTDPRRLVDAALFSPDGRYVLTATNVGVVRLWDARSRAPVQTRPLRELRTGPLSALAAAFSPDGRRLLTAMPGDTARIWDLETGRWLDLKGKHEGYVWSVAFSDDGKAIATAGDDGYVKLWDAGTGALLAEHKEHQERGPTPPPYKGALCVQFSRNLLLSSGKNGEAVAWDLNTRQVTKRYPYHRDWVWTVAAAPDNELRDPQLAVTGARDGTTCLWSLQYPHKPLFDLGVRAGGVQDAHFARDGRQVVTAGSDGAAEVWAVTQPVIVNTGANMNHVEFSADGADLVLAGDDAQALVWNCPTGITGGLVHPDPGINGATFLPGRRWVATAGADGVVRLWDVDDPRTYAPGEEKRRLDGKHAGRVNSVVVSPDGQRLVTTGEDSAVRLWDFRTGREVAKPFNREKALFRGGRFSPDGRAVAAAAADGAVYVLDAATLNLLRTDNFDGRLLAPGRRYAPGASARPWDVAFSPDGRWLVSADSDGHAYVWDARSWRLAGALDAGGEPVRSVDVSRDGRVAAGCADGAVRLWRLPGAFGRAGGAPAKAPPYLTLRVHQGAVPGVRFSPDGEYLATASADGTTRLLPATWDAYREKAGRIRALAGSSLGAPEVAPLLKSLQTLPLRRRP